MASLRPLVQNAVKELHDKVERLGSDLKIDNDACESYAASVAAQKAYGDDIKLEFLGLLRRVSGLEDYDLEEMGFRLLDTIRPKNPDDYEAFVQDVENLRMAVKNYTETLKLLIKSCYDPEPSLGAAELGLYRRLKSLFEMVSLMDHTHRHALCIVKAHGTLVGGQESLVDSLKSDIAQNLAPHWPGAPEEEAALEPYLRNLSSANIAANHVISSSEIVLELILARQEKEKMLAAGRIKGKRKVED